NATRGTLMHWVKLSQSKIATYQVITPTTWNASPRDSHAVPGHFEQSLVGLPPARPAAASGRWSWAVTTRASYAPPSRGNRAPDLIPAPTRVPGHGRRCRRTSRRNQNPRGRGAEDITGKDPDLCPHPATARRP